MLTFEDVKREVGRVSFRGWKFHVGRLGDGFYVQVRFEAPDTDWNPGMACSSHLPPLLEQRGRKWYISPHAIEDEVIKSCWLAVDTALRHEAMEEFRVDRVAVFHPHTNVQALLELQINRETPIGTDVRVARDAVAQA